MKRTTRMVALDTSSTVTGYAYFENAVYKESGVIDCKGQKGIEKRFDIMCEQISAILKKYEPHILVIEEPPFCNSPSTFRLLSEIVGTAIGHAILSGAEYVQYGPNVWRKLVASEEEKIPERRDDCKLWDMDKASETLRRAIEDDNEADAILIGIARVCEMLELAGTEEYQKKIMK